mgnify:CR=1 FL=1
MNGETIKRVLADNKHQMKDIAEKMGTSLSNLSAGLSKSDVRTGLLEKIADAAGLPIAVFYGDSFSQCQSISGNNNTQVAGNYASEASVLEWLKVKEEQLTLAMKQTSKAQEQMDRVLDRLEKNAPSDEAEVL